MNVLLEQKGDGTKANEGFTFVEVLVVVTLLTMMIYAVATLSVTGAESQEYARRLARVSEVTQDVVDDLRIELASNVRLFSNDAEGVANEAVFDVSTGPVPLPTRRLPTVSASESLRQDTVGSEICGNTIFFAKQAWGDRFVCTSGNEYLVDVLRWTYVYLTVDGSGPTVGNPIGLNLVRVVSEPLADAASVDAITDVTDQEEVLMHLANGTPDAAGESHDPCEVVWMRGQLPSVVGTFRQIDPSDGSMSATPFAGRPDPWLVLPADPTISGLLSYRHHSVATNYARGSFRVGRFAILDNSSTGFPHGFEVQIVGPTSARQILLHLSCSSTNLRGQWAGSDIQVIVDARDL